MDHDHPHYKWVVLSNTTLGILPGLDQRLDRADLAARHLPRDRAQPAGPGNVSYLLWDAEGYLVVTAVLVVPFGRLGDMFGRVRSTTPASSCSPWPPIALSVDPFHLDGGAVWLIGWRVIQGIGGAMLMSSSSAILTDAFPPTSAAWRWA